MADVFISHDSADSALAQRIAKKLKQAGLLVWHFRETPVPIGESLPLQIAQQIQSSKIVLHLVSRASLSSTWVTREIGLARNARRLVVAVMVDIESIPPEYEHTRWVDLRQNSQRDTRIDALVTECESALRLDGQRKIRGETGKAFEASAQGMPTEAAYEGSPSRRAWTSIHQGQDADVTEWLGQVDEIIDGYRARSNPFFGRTDRGAFSVPEIRRFAPEYFYFIDNFPDCLASVFTAVEREDQHVIANILYQEAGEGSAENRHSELFARLLRKLGLSEEEIRSGPKYEETSKLVAGMRQLYASRERLEALGAQYALEHQATEMIERLYKGFRGLPGLARADLDYFEVHMQNEPEHDSLMRDCVTRSLVTQKRADIVAEGARKLLDLLAAFWHRMANLMDAARQDAEQQRESLPSVAAPDRPSAIQTENAALRAVVGLLTGRAELAGGKPLILVGGEINTVAQWVGFVTELVTEYAAHVLPKHQRLYFAYALERPENDQDSNGEAFTAHYRFGVSKCGRDDWLPYQGASDQSNIGYVYHWGTQRYHRDTTRADSENQRVEEELSVVNLPVRLDDKSVGVLGISSPRPNDLEDQIDVGLKLQLFLEVALLQLAANIRSHETNQGRKASSPVERVRAELAGNFDASRRADA